MCTVHNSRPGCPCLQITILNSHVLFELIANTYRPGVQGLLKLTATGSGVYVYSSQLVLTWLSMSTVHNARPGCLCLQFTFSLDMVVHVYTSQFQAWLSISTVHNSRFRYPCLQFTILNMYCSSSLQTLTDREFKVCCSRRQQGLGF